MRRIMLSLVALGFVQSALAADYGEPYLRGSQSYYVPGNPAYYRWDGFYMGGTVGATYGRGDFGQGVGSLVANILRNTTIESEAQVSSWNTLSRSDAKGISFGGFAGWNAQWENAVLGVEVNYSWTNQDVAATDSIARSFTTSDGYFYNVSVDGSAGMKVKDYGSFRARAGWVFDNIMPYGFVGLALVRGDVVRSATVDLVATRAASPTLALNQTQAITSANTVGYGYALGLGADWAILPNVFLRAEYEYMSFGEIKDIKLQIQTARIGAGLKF
jgi:outer membrane immunogenic protein